MKGARRSQRFEIVTIDVADGFRPLRVPNDASGVALDFRHWGRPLGFRMQSVVGSSHIEPGEIKCWFEDLPEEDRGEPQASRVFGCMPSVTVAVCTKDHPDLLRRCLSSLERLVVEAADQPPEIIVVDNASTSRETQEVAGSFSRVRYVREELAGLNFARNRALREARGEILCFIDDDAVPEPSWLTGLKLAWSRCPDAGAFTGQTLPYRLDTKAQIVVERMGGFRKGFQPVVYGLENAHDPLYPCTTIFGNGCNMGFNVDVMRRLGGFDEALDMGAYLPGGGDLDALYQVVRAGWPLVYEPQMLVRHEHRRDMKGLRRQVRKSWGVGCMAFLTKIRDTDPEMRWKASAFIRWWVQDLFRRVVFFQNTPEQPWSMSFQELIGALIGLNGAYRRSRQRSARIRESHAG